MIVESGRKEIIKNGFGNGTITKAILGNSSELTDASMSSVADLGNITLETNKITVSQIEKDNILKYKITVVFDGDEIIPATCLGFFKGDILFSRVNFPTYYKSSTQKLTFEYELYF